MGKWACPLPDMNITYLSLYYSLTIPGIQPENYKACKEAKKCNPTSREEVVKRTRPRNSPGMAGGGAGGGELKPKNNSKYVKGSMAKGGRHT